MGQLFALYCVINLWHNGALSVVNLGVAEAPSKDLERLANQKKLDELHPPFRATVDADQRGAEGDGTLIWDTGVDAYIFGSAKPVEIAAGSAPLEIGSTDASMTLFHLARFGTVARYPYEASTVVLLSCNPVDLNRWPVSSSRRSGQVC
ncbi:hypothetical protein [Saccharomonospora azurea]|uniref:hypothetical protein n=1 Tax=Saccharomonospora azurea TaxID=40988 RepID=UPI003D94E7C1